LLPKQLEENALTSKDLTVYKSAILDLINNYTAEAGVRQLERVLGKVCRKAALEIAGKKDRGEAVEKITVTKDNLIDYAGKPKYFYDKVGRQARVGLVRGLAWTAAGGDTLEIEAQVMPGKGRLNITGQLGDVMQESCQVALAYVRSLSDQFKIEEDYFDKHDIHVHVPAGAVPKDGPSAGVTLTTAILSAITKTKVNADLAMTGEITLSGRVLPIGGLKEKLIAADRAGIKKVFIPEENGRDLDEVAPEVLDRLEIIQVSSGQELLDHIFK
jgi:ATP-dependent Lon protease